MSPKLDYIRIRNYIGGQWVDDPRAKTMRLFNPSDGKQIGEVPLSTETASRQAIDLPFGGIKQSLVGTDKAQGKDGVDFFTQNKIATVRFTPPSAARHPAEGGQAIAVPKTSAVKSCTAQ